MVETRGGRWVIGVVLWLALPAVEGWAKGLEERDIARNAQRLAMGRETPAQLLKRVDGVVNYMSAKLGSERVHSGYVEVGGARVHRVGVDPPKGPVTGRDRFTRYFVIANEYGLMHYQRENAAGVDLNRNFVDVPYDAQTGLWTKAPPENEGYPFWRDLLNPKGPARYRDWRHPAFLGGVLARLGTLTAQEVRKNPLRPKDAVAEARKRAAKTIMVGQHKDEFAEDLLYGGAGPQPERLALEKLLAEIKGKATALLASSYHTGYGPRGYTQRVASPEYSKVSRNLIEMFKQRVAGFGVAGEDMLYPMIGDWETFLNRLFSQIPSVIDLDELGTMGGAELVRQLKSLNTMVLMHQGRRYGFRPGHQGRIEKPFVGMFSLRDPWLWEQALREATARAEMETLFASSPEGRSAWPFALYVAAMHGVEGFPGVYRNMMIMMGLLPEQQQKWEIVFD